MKSKHFVILFMGTALTCAFVWVRLQIVSISYDINALAQQEKTIREACNGLILKVNEARSPRRLEHLASTKFGMSSPGAGQIVLMTGRN